MQQLINTASVIPDHISGYLSPLSTNKVSGPSRVNVCLDNYRIPWTLELGNEIAWIRRGHY